MPATQAPLWSCHRRACPIAATKGHGPGLGVKTPGKPAGIVPLYYEDGAGRGWSGHRRACPIAATKGHGPGLSIQTPGKPAGIVRMHYEDGRRRCGAGRGCRGSARRHPRAEIDCGRKQCCTDEDRACSIHFPTLSGCLTGLDEECLPHSAVVASVFCSEVYSRVKTILGPVARKLRDDRMVPVERHKRSMLAIRGTCSADTSHLVGFYGLPWKSYAANHQLAADIFCYLGESHRLPIR